MTAAVIVLPVEYINTEALITPAIWVTYGATSAEAIALLDTQAVVNGTNSQQATVNITWISITDYNGTSAGAYTATGTLALPADWIGTPDNVTATVNVSPAAYVSADALTAASIYVTYGATSAQAIALLDTSVGITGTLGERGTADIVWNITGYDATSAGAYEAVGTLTLPNSWTGTGQVTATVNVSPAAYASTDVLAVTSVSVTYGAAEAEALGLLQSTVPTVGVNGTNSEEGTATITWTTIAAYNATSPGSYVASGILALPASWSGSPDVVTAAVIVLPQGDQSGFDLIVMPGSPTIEGITFPLLITNAALTNGEPISGEAIDVWISNPSGYLGSINEDTALSFGGTEGDLLLHVQPDFFSGEATVPIFINTPGAHTLTVTIAGVTTSRSIEVVITESQADIAYEAPVIYLGSTTPAYITVTAITDASMNLRNVDFAADAGMMFEFGLLFEDDPEQIPGVVTKSAASMLIEIPNPSLLTTPGAYTITIDMADGNWWDIEIEVTPPAIPGDQSGFDLMVMPGAPTIEGIQFGLSITNAATTAGIPLTGEHTVVVSSQEGYLGTYDDSVVDGGTGQLTTFSTSVEFVEGGGGLPIFISTPGTFNLTVTVAGITTSQSIVVVIAESQADIAYEAPVIYLGSTTPAYITVTAITDASMNLRNVDFAADAGMMFEFGLLFEDDPEQIPGVVTKSAASMLIEIPNPSLLTTPGAYTITIDMADGNWWDIPIEVTVSAVGYTPQQMALYARFGSLVLDMEIEDSEGNILTWAAISENVDLEESVIEIQSASGEATPLTITFGGLSSLIDDVANTITFDGEPGLGGTSTGAFGSGGILEGFVPFEHDTVNVTIKAIDETWLVTASAIIPYLSIQHGLNTGNNLDLTVVYENMEGPSFSALSPANVNLLPAFSTEYSTALSNKVTVAAIGGGGYLYAYCWIPVPDMTTGGISTLEMEYNPGNNTFTITGTKDSGEIADVTAVLFFFDSSTYTLNSINLDIYTEEGPTAVDVNYMPRVEGVTDDDNSTLTVVFDSAMSGSSITNTANYMYSRSGNPITIAAVSYDEGAWAATVTIQGIVVVGDLFTISNDNELVDAQGFELGRQQYLLTTGGVWIENMGGPGGPGDSIGLYADEGGTTPSSTFEMGTMVYVLINDSSQSGTSGASIDYHVFSATDSTGVTLAAVDNTGTNMFGSAFFISAMPSSDTPGSYNLNTTIGGVFTVAYSGDSITATSIEPFEDSSGTTHASVDTYEEFVSAMADETIELIGINQDISATTFAINRPIEILFDSHTLTGTVSITTSALGEVTLSAPGTIAGILMIDAPNLTVNNEVTVTGETIIEGVGYDSYNSSGFQWGGILVNGPARLNLSASASSATVGIDTSQMVVLDGSIQTVQLIASGSKARVLGTIDMLAVTTGAIGSLIEAYSGSSIGQVLASESTMLMKEVGATVGSTMGAVLDNVAYRVTFDKNGGDTQAFPAYLLWDNNTETSNAMPTPPTKADFTFGGWNSQSDGGGTMMTTVYAVSSPVTAYAVWEGGNVEIEGYDPFAPIDGGDVGTPTYEDATAVITYLESNLTCAAITGQSQVVPISGWTDTDTYNSSVAASYTFTAAVGTLPPGFVDEVSPITHVTVEVVVSVVEPPTITRIVAAEGGTHETGIGNGDTIAIEFNVPTNYANLPYSPDTVSREAVNSFVELYTARVGQSPSLGAEYHGYWETTMKFVITVDDATGANFVIGDEISIRESAGLKTQNELSVASTSRAEVTGSFDPVYNGAAGFVQSPTGMAISGVEVYAGISGGLYSDITDGDGMYEIDYPTEGSITMFFVHDYWYDDVADNLSAPNPGYFEKTMTLGAKITGTVTYGGSPAVGFTVKDSMAGTEAIVGGDGSFSLRGVPSATSGSTRYLNVLNLSGVSVIGGSLIEVPTIAFQTTSGVSIVIP